MTLEETLLALLKPGEMLRFAIVRDGDGFDYGIEGAGRSGSEEGWRERLDTTLRLAREGGYSFVRESIGGEGGRTTGGRRGGAGKPRIDDGREWKEIRPLLRRLSSATSGRLGFGDDLDGGERGYDPPVWFPAFVPLLPRDLFPKALASLKNAPGFEALELDFESVALPPDWIAPLSRLRSRADEWSWPGSGGGGNLAEGGGIGLARQYLDLWLWHRTGWKVRLRVAASGEAARASLELAGRCLFGTECELTDRIVPPTNLDGALRLEGWYPAAWRVPPILPRSQEESPGGVRRLHNPTRPRLPRSGVPVGSAEGDSVRFPTGSREAHTYIAGATGTGKSTLLLRLIEADLKRGESVVVLDPHGDLCQAALELVPSERAAEVIRIDPHLGSTPAFNVLDIVRDRFHRRSVDLLAGGLMSFFLDAWEGVDAFGPVFETYFLNTLLLLALQRKHKVSLRDFSRVLTNTEFRRNLLDSCDDELVRRFWKETAEPAGRDISLANVAPYITSKIDPLIQSDFLGKMLAGGSDEIALGWRMDNRGIVLANLDKGSLGARQSQLLGTLLSVQIFSAGLVRSTRPSAERPPVNVYIDEFQNFVSGNLAAMLSEARKFGLRLTLANQTLGQLEGGSRSHLIDAVLGNAGNQIFFRLGVSDSRRLADFTAPLSPREMQFLPNHHALARILDEGCPLPPFVFRTLPAPRPTKGRARPLKKK